jgi:glycosyltransferase involved in cell wall biosynthesis
MKILMCSPRLPPDEWSGAGRAFRDLSRYARPHAEVQLVAGWRRERGGAPVEAAAVELSGLSEGEARVRFGRAVWAEARRFKPDVVVSRTIALPPLGAPLVAVVQQVVRVRPTPRDRLRLQVYARAARRAAAVVVPDSATARHLVGAGLPEGRVRTIPVGVDTDHFRPLERLEGRDPRLHVVCAGRILPEKGQHLALDAVARLLARDKRQVRLTIAGAVGDPVYLDQLRVQAYDQPVSFVLNPPKMAPTLQDADVVVVPSIVEAGFSTTAVEAMACGAPVIWFDQPALREATGGHGIAVPPDDVVAMRGAIRSLLADPSEREKLGAEGRRYVTGMLGWDRVWEQWHRLFESLA